MGPVLHGSAATTHAVRAAMQRSQATVARLADLVNAYNYARRLKTLRGLTPYAFIVKRWTEGPERFRINPAHHTPGLNTEGSAALPTRDQPPDTPSC